MNIIQKYKNRIIIGVLVVIGIFTVVFGKSSIVQGTLTSLCWGTAILIFSYTLNNTIKQELEEFEIESHEILKDIATNGEDSPYYGEYNIDIINRIRQKVEKKARKQVMSCVSLGVILIIIAIICAI